VPAAVCRECRIHSQTTHRDRRRNDLAIQSAGGVLASSDPRGVIGVIELSEAGYRKVLQNLAWAAGYNVIAIPLAAGVLAPVGIVLAPAVGAILMNAQLLRRLDLRPDRTSAQPA
jgi:Cu2+-exporting ATPase